MVYPNYFKLLPYDEKRMPYDEKRLLFVENFMISNLKGFGFFYPDERKK